MLFLFYSGVLSLNCSCAHDFLCFDEPTTVCTRGRICFAAEVRTSNGSILVKKGMKYFIVQQNLADEMFKLGFFSHNYFPHENKVPTELT